MSQGRGGVNDINPSFSDIWYALPVLLDPRRKTDVSKKERHAAERIRCPLCDWTPTPSSRWCCYGADTPEAPFTGCGNEWNTFDTRGKCPGCGHQWRWTSCLRCGGWSLHEAWYVEE